MSSKNMYFVVLYIFVYTLVSANSQTVHKRFEYKYSFKPPYLAQKDGTVPFWEYGGNAIASGESVRLAPSLRSQKGAIWSKNPINFDWWEVDVMFKVTGRGRIGADGLAFWYTTQKGDYTGEVFGSSDKWNGLAIIFDSFDNDNKHNNPYIMAVVNDGTRTFDHKNDGSTQQLAGCLRDFRNKPFPTRARVEYYANTLTVYFHNGMTTNEADYELCFRAENVQLPRGGYLGVSAATGGLADDHDVIHLLTSSLHSQQQQQGGQQISNDEQQKLSQEYQEYQRKLEQQKEDYRKEHPDEMRDKDAEMEDWFESDGQRELRQIFQGQGQMHDILKDLNKKVDEVVGKQMSALSMLTALYTHAQGQPMQQGHAPAQLGSLPIGRQDWDVLLANNQLMINTIAELKGFIIEVSRKSDSILASSGQVAGSGPGQANTQLLAEIRENINQVKQSVAGVAQRISSAPLPGAQAQVSCPSCVSLWGLLAVLSLQLVAMFLYSLYKERKEAQAKKFF